MRRIRGERITVRGRRRVDPLHQSLGKGLGHFLWLVKADDIDQLFCGFGIPGTRTDQLEDLVLHASQSSEVH